MMVLGTQVSSKSQKLYSGMLITSNLPVKGSYTCGTFHCIHQNYKFQSYNYQFM